MSGPGEHGDREGELNITLVTPTRILSILQYQFYN